MHIVWTTHEMLAQSPSEQAVVRHRAAITMRRGVGRRSKLREFLWRRSTDSPADYDKARMKKTEAFPETLNLRKGGGDYLRCDQFRVTVSTRTRPELATAGPRHDQSMLAMLRTELNINNVATMLRMSHSRHQLINSHVTTGSGSLCLLCPFIPHHLSLVIYSCEKRSLETKIRAYNHAPSNLRLNARKHDGTCKTCRCSKSSSHGSSDEPSIIPTVQYQETRCQVACR